MPMFLFLSLGQSLLVENIYYGLQGQRLGYYCFFVLCVFMQTSSWEDLKNDIQ